MQDTMEREKYSRLDLRETKLINCMNWKDKERALCGTDEIDGDRITAHEQFVLKQYAASQLASVFDLLFWIKFSTPVDDFDPDIITSILDSLLVMLENQVLQYEDEAARAYELCYEMLKDQFLLFMDNLKDSAVTRPSASKRLHDNLVEAIAVSVDDHIRAIYGLDPRFDDTMVSIYEKALTE
jgi:hypothetical protein